MHNDSFIQFDERKPSGNTKLKKHQTNYVFKLVWHIFYEAPNSSEKKTFVWRAAETTTAKETACIYKDRFFYYFELRCRKSHLTRIHERKRDIIMGAGPNCPSAEQTAKH